MYPYIHVTICHDGPWRTNNYRPPSWESIIKCNMNDHGPINILQLHHFLPSLIIHHWLVVSMKHIYCLKPSARSPIIKWEVNRLKRPSCRYLLAPSNWWIDRPWMPYVCESLSWLIQPLNWNSFRGFHWKNGSVGSHDSWCWVVSDGWLIVDDTELMVNDWLMVKDGKRWLIDG